MLKLIFLQSLHGIKVLRDWNVISVDGSWTLRHMLENVADGTEGCYKRDSWTLDTALRGLPLLHKVGLSLTIDNALEFGKYFWFILQRGGEGSGVAQSCTLWDVGLCLYCSFLYHGNRLLKKKSLVPCWILLTSLDQKPVIKFVWHYTTFSKGGWRFQRKYFSTWLDSIYTIEEVVCRI